MPIISYIAYPHNGKKSELFRELSDISQCEVLPAENKDVIILVTDTSNQEEEENLKLKLETVKSLKLLSMVSGFEDSSKTQ